MADSEAADPSRILSQRAIDAGYLAARADIGRFNLGLFGITGVGKSTLLNAVFGANVARTGIGDPVTQESTLYRSDLGSLGIFDTKGLELGSDMADILRDFLNFIDQNRLGSIDDQIHVIWYCIRAGDRRIQPAEESFIRRVASIGIPVLLVMTQTPLTATGDIHPDAEVLAAAIRELRLPIRADVHFVNARADDFAAVPSHGLDELLAATSEVVPEGVRNALAAAQQVDRRFKRARATSLTDAAAAKLKGKILLRGIDEVWAELFAGIAEVYDMPEARSREVIEQVGTVLRARRVLHLASAGRILSPLGIGMWPVLVQKVSAGGGTAGNAVSRRFRRHKAAAQPRADAQRQADEQQQGDETGVPAEDAKRVGSGFAAGKVTRAMGEAWLETCDHYWAASYPQPASYSDTEGIANHFADDLQARLPRVVRKWEAWKEERGRK